MGRTALSPKDDPHPGLGAAVIDALPISLYVVDRKLKLVVWNSRREQGPLGRPRHEVLGRHLRDILGPRGFKATLPTLKRVFETGQIQEETVETGARLFHLRRIPVKRDQTVTHVLCWFEDITEQKALEMRVIASDRLAFLGQLVAGVAHEISNPLAGIAGCAEALASIAMHTPGKTHREAREFRELIRGEVARCERIVRSLLDTARPSQGSSADVAAVVASALRLLDRHPAFSRVRVISRIPADLPAAKIEPDFLKQVVTALAANAARAMSGGGTLSLRAACRNDEIHLDVLDTGPGVPPELRSQIFKPYFTTNPERGTGLGLAIARSLVRGRGGDLALRPRQRPGGSFRVTLKAGANRP